MNRPGILLVLLVLVIATNGCLAIESLFDRPSGDIVGVTVRDITFDRATVELTVAIENIYSVILPVTGYDYTLQVEGIPVAAGAVEVYVQIPPGETASLKVPLQLRYDDVRAILQRVGNAAQAHYRAQARLYVITPITDRYPMDFERLGKLPVPRMPRFKLLGIGFNRETPMSSRVTLRLRVINPNTFKMNIQQLDYAVVIEGQNLATGKVLPDPSIEPDADTVVELQIDVQAEDVRRALLAALRAENFSYAVTGTLITDTEYGPMETALAIEGTWRPQEEIRKEDAR